MQNGVWVMGSDGFENTRPVVKIEVSVNPVATSIVSYPAVSLACYPGPAMNLVDDIVTVSNNESLLIPIYANDSGIGNDFTKTVPSQSEKGGSIVVNPDRTITYTPAFGFAGADTFTYQVCNSMSPPVCMTATVTISVTGISLIEDDDHDGILNYAEDLNGDGNPANDDSDGDGIPNYLDPDDDNDSVLTKNEAYKGNVDPTKEDTDGDGIPDYLDIDDDNDTVLTKNEAYNGNTDPMKQDSDGDGIPDYLDVDDDDDGILTKNEDINNDINPMNDDLDGDKIPNYLDWDDDGDGIPTRRELLDLNGNGIPDYLEVGSLFPPLAIDDEVETGIDAPVSFFPLDNDSLSFDKGSLEIITHPDHGTVTYNPNTGEMTYTPDPDYTGIQEIVYEVCNSLGECDQGTIIVTVVDIIDPPQIVTPNDDGTNDTWIVNGLVHYPDNKVSIFNRWGNLVFEKVGYINEWDGTSNQKKIGNSPLPVGTYYYIITYGTNLHKTGYVVLDR